MYVTETTNEINFCKTSAINLFIKQGQKQIKYPAIILKLKF